ARGAALRLERPRQTRVQEGLELALGRVRRGADARPLFGREGAERAEELGQDALAAEEPDADLLKLGGGLRGGDGLTRFLRDRAGAEDGLGRRTVELAPSADVPLRLLEDLLAPAACLRSTLCSWHTSRPPRSEIGHERPQTALVARVDQLVRAEVPAPLRTLL